MWIVGLQARYRGYSALLTIGSTNELSPTAALNRRSQDMEPRMQTIGLVDDHELVLVALAERLARISGIGLVITAKSVPELLERFAKADATHRAPNLVLLDLRLADGTRPRTNVEQLTALGAHVLAYTSGEDVGLLREAVHANVLGVISKREPVTAVIDAVQRALSGEVVASTDWAAVIDGDLDAIVHLTPREREVLSLYANGETADSVARMLWISRDTVLDHIRRIRAKYAAVSRPADTKIDLYRQAAEDGLIIHS